MHFISDVFKWTSLKQPWHLHDSGGYYCWCLQLHCALFSKTWHAKNIFATIARHRVSLLAIACLFENVNSCEMQSHILACICWVYIALFPHGTKWQAAACFLYLLFSSLLLLSSFSNFFWWSILMPAAACEFNMYLLSLNTRLHEIFWTMVYQCMCRHTPNSCMMTAHKWSYNM